MQLSGQCRLVGGPAGLDPYRPPIAEEALRRIQSLYAIEAAITGKTADERQSARQEHAIPILVTLQSWMTEQRRRLSSKTGLAKALQYALTRWDALCLYTTDGRIVSTTTRLSNRCAGSR